MPAGGGTSPLLTADCDSLCADLVAGRQPGPAADAANGHCRRQAVAARRRGGSKGGFKSIVIGPATRRCFARSRRRRPFLLRRSIGSSCWPITRTRQLPLGWSPLVLDAGKIGSSLSDWIQLPLAGVDQLILPGFHTPAENALKRGGTGDEVFLAVCGLMASGSRTALISRWRVGGQSMIDLVREFVQELPHESAASAWRRSVLLDRAASGSFDRGSAETVASSKGRKPIIRFFGPATCWWIRAPYRRAKGPNRASSQDQTWSHRFASSDGATDGPCRERPLCRSLNWSAFTMLRNFTQGVTNGPERH